MSLKEQMKAASKTYKKTKGASKKTATKKTATKAMLAAAKKARAAALAEKHKVSLARNAEEIASVIDSSEESLLVGKPTKTGGRAVTTIPMSIWKKSNKATWAKDYPEAKSIREAYRFYYAGATKALGAYVAGQKDLFVKRVGWLRSGSLTVSHGRQSESTLF